jgi:type IX secretion system substrate protein
MKRIPFLFTLVAFVCLSLNSSAQWIDSFIVTPSNPTIGDTIIVYANVSFPSGGCEEKVVTHSVLGQQVLGNSLHCLGVLSVICSTTDTFKINPLPAGIYTFVLQLNAGQSPAPCTPGINPGPVDSVSFTVSPTVSLNEVYKSEIIIFPNPTSSSIQLNLDSNVSLPVYAEVYSTGGKLILRQKINSFNQKVDISGLAGGQYIVRAIDQKQTIGQTRIEVIR